MSLNWTFFVTEPKKNQLQTKAAENEEHGWTHGFSAERRFFSVFVEVGHSFFRDSGNDTVDGWNLAPVDAGSLSIIYREFTVSIISGVLYIPGGYLDFSTINSIIKDVICLGLDPSFGCIFWVAKESSMTIGGSATYLKNVSQSVDCFPNFQGKRILGPSNKRVWTCIAGVFGSSN